MSNVKRPLKDFEGVRFLFLFNIFLVCVSCSAALAENVRYGQCDFRFLKQPNITKPGNLVALIRLLKVTALTVVHQRAVTALISP